MAYLIDAIFRGLALGALLMLLAMGGLVSDVSGGAAGGAFLVVLFALEWGYYVFFETLMRGQSPGKRILRLRVVNEQGHAINFGDSVMRNLLRAVDFLPTMYALGTVVCALDPRFRRLGDIASGTLVVVEPGGKRHETLRIDPPPTEEELAAVPGRPPLSADDLEALELFLRRLGTLNAVREDELASIVAPIYTRRLGYAPRLAPARLLALLYHRATGR